MEIEVAGSPELPHELLVDIFALLAIPDLKRASSVCSSWRSVYTSLCNRGLYKRQLSFARLGDDKWTWLPQHSYFHDCIYKDGLLYAVTAQGKILAFNLRGPVATTELIMDITKDYIYENIYIVEAPCGGLLQVWRTQEASAYVEDADPATDLTNTANIEIFKVDTTAEKLVGIDSLDDHVLLLGLNQTLCPSVEEYPHLKANHAYFTDDCKLYLFGWQNNRRDIGIYDLANNTCEELVSPQLWSNWPNPIWITPSLTRL